MLFTVRQNSLPNYRRLPIWFVTVGSLFQLAMMVLLVYQSIYMTQNPYEGFPEFWSNFIKCLYVVGLIGPILNWVFIYFLIARLNEKVASIADPGFLDTAERECDDEDSHEKALVNLSREVVYFDDLQRKSYKNQTYSSPKDSP